ncbi:chitin synthase activator [Apiospora marii]|uniref:Chitin synthase activator n=1 Tax=Apiospora marii TaxID=335849 RepID=A0ABR1T1D4_9PEZI
MASDATSGVQSMGIRPASLKYIKGLSGPSSALCQDLRQFIHINAEVFSGKDYTRPSPQIDRDLEAGFDFLDASDGDSDVDSHPSETEDSIFGLQKFSLRLTIDQLARFSTMIRRSGTKFRFGRADSRLIMSDHLEFQEELSVSILLGSLTLDPRSSFTVDVLESNGFEQLTIVQQRLVQGNIFRRNRIMHATKSIPTAKQTSKRDASNMLEQFDAWGGSGLSNNITDTTPQRQQPTPQDSQAERHTTPSITGTRMTRLTAITATEIGPHFKPDLSTLKSSPSITTEVTKTGFKQDYPRCPNPATKGFIKCPYCADMLPAGYKKNVIRWKGHVAQDILPYMCIYKDCPTPGEMYLTSDDLHKHMQDHHSVLRWVCTHCSRHPDRRQLSTFNTISEWQKHIQDAHRSVVPESGLASLAKFSETTLDEHIMQHMHKFALRSLPWGTKEDDAEYVSTNASTESDRNDSFDDWSPFSRPVAKSLAKVLEDTGNILHLFLDRPKADLSFFCRGWTRKQDPTSMLDEVDIELQAATDYFDKYEKYVKDHSNDVKFMCFNEPSIQGPMPRPSLSIDSRIVNDGKFMLILSGPSMSGKTLNVLHYAQSLKYTNFHWKVFWVNVQGSDLCRATRLDQFDQVFGEIGPHLLGMDDLLSVLAVADRGTSFVDAMLHSMNNKSRERWLVVLDGVNTGLNVFFSGVRIPGKTVRGMVILTTREDQIPTPTSCSWIDTRLQTQRNPYDALEADNRIDNILLPGDTVPQYDDRPGITPSTDSPRLVGINLVRPTPPSSLNMEQQQGDDMKDSSMCLDDIVQGEP